MRKIIVFLIEHIGNLLQISALLLSGYCIYYSKAYFNEFGILDFTNPLESFRLFINTGDIFLAVLSLEFVAVNCLLIYKLCIDSKRRVYLLKEHHGLTSQAKKTVTRTQELSSQVEELKSIKLPDDIGKTACTLIQTLSEEAETLHAKAETLHAKAKKPNWRAIFSIFLLLIPLLGILISMFFSVQILISMPKSAAEKVKVDNRYRFQVKTDSQAFSCLSLIAKNSEFYYLLEPSTFKVLLIPIEKLNEISACKAQ